MVKDLAVQHVGCEQSSVAALPVLVDCDDKAPSVSLDFEVRAQSDLAAPELASPFKGDIAGTPALTDDRTDHVRAGSNQSSDVVADKCQRLCMFCPPDRKRPGVTGSPLKNVSWQPAAITRSRARFGVWSSWKLRRR